MSDHVDTVVWVDGGLADPATAAVHWSDHGLTVGDGVFETIELRGGRPFALTRHLARLGRSAEGLGLAPPEQAAVLRAIDEVSTAWGPSPGRLRVTYTAGEGPMGSQRSGATPTLVVAACAMAVQTDPTVVHVVDWTRNERSAVAGLKTTSYAENVVALAAANDRGASEAIFSNTRDELCEGTGSNVFVVLDGELVTPPLESGCLAGVTRALLLDALAAAGAPATQRAVPMSELAAADEAFLVSTARHVQPIRRIDEVELDPCPGPLTSLAADVWRRAYDEAVDP